MKGLDGRAARVTATLLLGAAAALGCVRLGTPLPWTIGPLVATALLGVAGAPLAASVALRNAGQWAIGTVLGLYFTPQVVAIVLGHGGAILAGIAWALALGAAFGAFLRRTNPGAQQPDAATAYFAGAIGSASEMAVLAERHGARVDLVASAHSLRVLMVVVGVPFAFQFVGLHGIDPSLPGPQVVRGPGLVLLCTLTALGGAAMQRLKVTNPWVIGALGVAFALTAGGIELSAMPKVATNAAQLFIAVALGARFTPAFLHTAPRWLASVALGTLLLIGLSALFALAVARASGLHPATVMLATAPGGIAEMCITATVLQLGVPVVTAFHVTRMAAVVLLVGPLFRLRQRA